MEHGVDYTMNQNTVNTTVKSLTSFPDFASGP